MKSFPVIANVTNELLESAMDEHAKRIAVAFAEWVNREEQNNGLVGDESFGWYYSKPAKDGPGFTVDLVGNTIDLYKLFLRQILI